MENRRETEEVVENRRGNSKLKVAYTNINGLVSGIIELNDYLRESKPDIMGEVETKLRGELPPDSVGRGQYNSWLKNRDGKQGEGVMILIKKNLKVTQVGYGENSTELVTVKVEDREMESREFVVTYVPPKTRSGNGNDYAAMLEDKRHYLTNVLEKGNKTIIMGDFNSKEVCWEGL